MGFLSGKPKIRNVPDRKFRGRVPCNNCRKGKCRRCSGGNCYCKSQGHHPPRGGGPSMGADGAPLGCCGHCLGSRPVK